MRDNTPSQLSLRQTQSPPDPTRVFPQVLHGLFLVYLLLQGDLRFGGGIHPYGMECCYITPQMKCDLNSLQVPDNVTVPPHPSGVGRLFRLQGLWQAERSVSGCFAVEVGG